MTKRIAISEIRTDGGTQPRVEVSSTVVSDYAEDMVNGDKFPPITIFNDGECYWLADGFHRLLAAKAADQDKIECEVRKGSQRDAALHAVGCNATHGFRRSNADKRAAVMRLLKDEEWSRWSDREIARRACVDNAFVSRLRNSICGRTTDRPRRKVSRGGKTYEMNTAKIGNGAVPKPTEPERVVVDVATGSVVSSPWSEEQHREYARRDDFTLTLIDNLEWLVSLTADQVYDDVLPEEREEVGHLLARAVAHLRDVHSTWRKKHVTQEM